MRPVYVIDDDEDVRDVIVFALENEKFSVHAYENPVEAFGVLERLDVSERPGLIIVDYLMPEMDGHEFINKIRKLDAYKETPIAFSTAMGHSDPEQIPLENVIDLHKPMELDDLLRVVKKYCS